MYLRRLFSLHNSLQPQIELNKSIFLAKHIQAVALITENPQTTTTLSVSHDAEWTPSSISYSKRLHQCCQTKSLNAGLQIHTELIKRGLENDPTHINHLVNLYSKCGIFRCARKLLDESPEPNLVAWSALISGYVENGLGKEALLAFTDIHSLGIRCNEFTFPSVLKACSMKKDIIGGKQIHGIVVVTGFDNDVYVANSLVVLYAKCGDFLDARKLFDQIPDRNIVSWNAFFSCYSDGGFFNEAIVLFQEMIGTGLFPDKYSLSSIIKACTGLHDRTQGKKIHGYLIKHGYSSDIFSSNALVDMYSKVGDFEDARTVFNHIPNPDIVSWNAIISACVHHEHFDLGVELFFKMKRSGIIPSMITFSIVLKACSGLGLQNLGQQFHSIFIKSNIELDPFLCCGLIDIYSRCGEMDDAQRLYDTMPHKELAALNALLRGHSQNENEIEALTLFTKHKDGIGFDETTLSAILNCSSSLQDVYISEQIHGLSLKSGFQSDPFVINSLIDSYSKCSHVERAKKVFDESDIADLATFTSLISAYSQSGQGEEAIKLYLKMQDLELKPDPHICSSLLNAAANLSAYEQGKQIHVHTLKSGLLSDVHTANTLVSMYAKCGSIEDARRAFFEVPKKGIVSWSAIIGGLAQHGHGKEALSFFEKMLKDGIAPNNLTLASVLSACNHAGLVTQAKIYFESMEGDFGIKPTQEHYACMIDILGRAGQLDEAINLLDTMPFEANASVWGAVLGAARTHKNVDLGQRASRELLVLEPEKSGTHVLLANIYASVGLWEEVAGMRRLMKDSKVKKEPGMSWLEVKDQVHTFIVGDRSHFRTHEIYKKLEEVMDLIREEGYVPVLENDLHNVRSSEKEVLLLYHSEKLAVAFGLIATPPRAPIRVKKNLRVCIDCHTFLKFVSKVVTREIIVRDINRFHHFRDGFCSCGDYW